MKILLASQSPRRKELLSQLGYEFETVSIDCDENFPEEMPAEKVAGYLSELKSSSFRNLEKNEILITADTVVANEGNILGKPFNEEEAKKMLASLSGKKHQVYTSITIKTSEKSITKTDVANVYFDAITNYESEFYLKKFAPFDKAGSYGIQDWIGMAKVSKIEGSFYTIMGLPTHLVYSILQEILNK